jgi:F-box-like
VALLHHARSSTNVDCIVIAILLQDDHITLDLKPFAMVSADNLPFDVLPLIFHFLSSGSDLVSVVLVSKSFSSGVLPLIYATIAVRTSLVKRLAGVSIQI